LHSILLKRLRECSWNRHHLNVRELMQYYVLDVIGEITVGSRFGFMKEDGDKAGILTIFDKGLTHASKFGLFAELHWYLVKASKFLNMKLYFIKVMNFVFLHITNRVSGRTKPPDDREDFLDKLLLLEQNGKATRGDMINAYGSNIRAGSDTTAISLTAAIAYLSMNPTELAKLREELEDATNSGITSDPITFKEAQKLPYLHAVIQETLRIHLLSVHP
jgi:cytochrome P450